jgi:two-component system sensor histidine kinase MprB
MVSFPPLAMFGLRAGVAGGRTARALKVPSEPFGGAAGYLQLIPPSGKAIRPPKEASQLPVSPSAKAIATRGGGEHLADQHVGSVHLRVLTTGLPGGGALQIARPLTEVDNELHDVLLVLILVGVAGIALGAALGAFVARTALAPIARFTRRTETLASELDLSQRIDVAGRDELARLALSFNTTLDALERSVQAQRHLVADASHELRTPIASLRANVQVLEDADRLPPEERESLRADIVGELDQLTALVGDVVELARGAQPGAALDDVRLDEIVAALAERAQRRAGGAVDIHLDLEPTVVTGDSERIARAVGNLLDNARKEPRGRRDRRPPGRRDADRPRPRPGLPRGGPAARLRALLPRQRGAWAARLWPRPGDRAPGGRVARRLRRRRERGRRRRRAPGSLRDAARRRAGGPQPARRMKSSTAARSKSP